jgi:hypothetical protein
MILKVLKRALDQAKHKAQVKEVANHLDPETVERHLAQEVVVEANGLVLLKVVSATLE